MSGGLVNDDYIKWDPKYKIGIPAIDEQHETLVRRCLNYAATHFQDEEKLMLASNFDGYKKHKKIHDDFTEKCKDIYAGIDRLPASEAIKFAHFLYDWIHTHIAYEDRLYLPALLEFLKKKANK